MMAWERFGGTNMRTFDGYGGSDAGSMQSTARRTTSSEGYPTTPIMRQVAQKLQAHCASEASTSGSGYGGAGAAMYAGDAYSDAGSMYSVGRQSMRSFKDYPAAPSSRQESHQMYGQASCRADYPGVPSGRQESHHMYGQTSSRADYPVAPSSRQESHQMYGQESSRPDYPGAPSCRQESHQMYGHASSRASTSRSGYGEAMYAAHPGSAASKPQSSIEHYEASLVSRPFEIEPELVQQIFAKWERGLITDAQFQEHLYMDVGLQPNREILRLLEKHTASRNLSFAKLLQALKMTHCKPPVFDSASHRHALYQTPQDTPVSTQGECWNDGRATPSNQSVRSGAPQSWVDDGPGTPCNMEMHGPRTDYINKVISNFIDGITGSSTTFRGQLERCGVQVTEEIDRLIRKHEAGNSIKYRDFARLMLRSDPSDSRSQCMESSSNSGLAAPYAALDRGPQLEQYVQNHRFSSAYGDSDAGSERRTPYATVHDLKARHEQMEASPTPLRKFSERRGHGNGDILSWRDNRLAEAAVEPEASPASMPSRRASFGGKLHTNGDIIGWGTGETAPRKPLAKKYFDTNEFGQRPFGRDSDLNVEPNHAACREVDSCATHGRGSRR